MGQLDVLKFLQSKGADLFKTDVYEETPLHIASRQGHVRTVEELCKYSQDINQPNEEGESALHLAAYKGHLEVTQCLINAGAITDLQNKHGCTALHLALHKQNTAIAILLLQCGCNIDVLDDMGEAPIHSAARQGLLPIAQTLCAFGCKVDVQNKAGQYPLHLAARNGHTEVVRCLCLAGCNTELKDKDGIAAEICALAQGYDEMADILNKLRSVHLKEESIAQLIPTSRCVSRVKLKLLGHSGVGKSTFIQSLKCGYFTSWFKRSIDSVSPSFSKIGNGMGNVSLWEFSGHEPYYMCYDNFIGNTNCLHLVFFSLEDEYEVQVQQVLFWLAFLQSRIPVHEPLGFCGKSGKPGHVALVATHADAATCLKVVASGEYASSEATSVLRLAQSKFQHIFYLCDCVFVMDAQIVGSPAMKSLKAYVAQQKEKLTQGLPKSTGFLEAVCAQLPAWRKSQAAFPVVEWSVFVKMVHSTVNALAGEEHLKELIQQLQIMGEVLYITGEVEDVVVLDPSWLCGSVLGELLSQESFDKARVTGIYSVHDLQLLFPDTDAQQLLPILEALQLCEADDDLEYEFPCFNVMEMADDVWNPSPSHFSCYGGVRLFCKNKYFLNSVFPKIQVNLCRLFKNHTDSECELFQSFQSSKLCCGQLESLVTLNGDSCEVKVRGPSTMTSQCFFFQEDIVCLIEQVYADVCPGLSLERHVFSSLQLQSHLEPAATYSPALIIKTLLEDGIYGTVTEERNGIKETLLSLLFFNNLDVLKHHRSLLNARNENEFSIPRSKTFSSFSQNDCPKQYERRCSVPQNSRNLHQKLYLLRNLCCFRQEGVLENINSNLPHKHSNKTNYLQERTTSISEKISLNKFKDKKHICGPSIMEDDQTCKSRGSAVEDDSQLLAQNSIETNLVCDISQRCLNDQSIQPQTSGQRSNDVSQICFCHSLKESDKKDSGAVPVQDLHALQLPLLSVQCLCALLDPQDAMGKDWCMLGVLLGMEAKISKIDPGSNPAFSPTACILHEWMKYKYHTLGQLLEKLQELQREDAVENLIPLLPFFKME